MGRSLLVRQAAPITFRNSQIALCKLSLEKRQDIRRIERIEKNEQARYDQSSDWISVEKCRELKKIHRCKSSILGLSRIITKGRKRYKTTQ